MFKSDAIAHFGSIEKLSKILNCDRRAIYQWGELVPEARQYEIEVKTAGLLRSDYTISRAALSTGGSSE